MGSTGARVTCRDHLAGELGGAITNALVTVELSDEGATVTAVGRALFSAAAFLPNGGQEPPAVLPAVP